MKHQNANTLAVHVLFLICLPSPRRPPKQVQETKAFGIAPTALWLSHRPMGKALHDTLYAMSAQNLCMSTDFVRAQQHHCKRCARTKEQDPVALVVTNTKSTTACTAVCPMRGGRGTRPFTNVSDTKVHGAVYAQFFFLGGIQALASWRSSLTTRHSRKLSESRIRAAQPTIVPQSNGGRNTSWLCGVFAECTRGGRGGHPEWYTQSGG